MTTWLPFAAEEDGWYGETTMRNPVVGGDDHVMGHKLLTFHLIKNTFQLYERFEFEKMDSGWTLTMTNIQGGGQTVSVSDETFEEYASAEWRLSIIFNETGEQKIKSSDYAVGDKVDIRTYLPMEQVARASLPELIASQISDLSSFKGKVSTLESTASDLETDVSTLTADKETLEGKVSTLESDNSTLNATVSTLESDNATLNTTVSQLGEDVTTLSNANSTLEGQVSTLESDNASLNETVSGLETDLGSLSSANDTLNSTVSTLEGNVTTLTSDKEALEGQVSTLESTIADLTTRLEALEASDPE